MQDISVPHLSTDHRSAHGGQWLPDGPGHVAGQTANQLPPPNRLQLILIVRRAHASQWIVPPHPWRNNPCDEPGITVIGRSVRKEFNAGWFDGTVTQFDAQTCLYKVVYSDKDSEVMAFSELSDIIADERYIGCAVRKEFNDGWFNGTVTSFDPDSSNY